MKPGTFIRMYVQLVFAVRNRYINLAFPSDLQSVLLKTDCHYDIYINILLFLYNAKERQKYYQAHT